MRQWTEEAIRSKLDEMVEARNNPPPPSAPVVEPPKPPERQWLRLATRDTTCGDVMRTVLNVTGVSFTEFKSPRRAVKLVHARHIYCYACRMWTDKSYPFIGSTINRDHSTVLHAIESVEKKRHRYEPHLTMVMDILEIEAKQRAA